MKPYLKFTLFLLMGIGSTSVFAMPVQWTLQGMTFSNGSVVTGTFDFDVNTNTFSNIAISMTAGTDFAAQSFDAIAPNSGNYYGAIFATLPLSYNDTPACANFNDTTCGTNAFGLNLYPAQMSNAGGVIAASSAWLGHCGDASCNSGSWSFNQDYSTTGGSIAAVPEADTYAMMLAGLGLVGAIVRRRNQTTD